MNIGDNMHHSYKTQYTCASRIDFDLEDGIVKNVRFQGGCQGNLTAIPILLEGMKAEDVIAKLRGVRCGFKNTSCTDQLAQALERALKK